LWGNPEIRSFCESVKNEKVLHKNWIVRADHPDGNGDCVAYPVIRA
jgi:hypothetical protein